MSLVMPVTEEERNADQGRRGQKDTFFNSNMYFYGREVCFILALLITSYAAFQNSPPKISKSPSPVPFFPRNSLVADFYNGQLSPAFERVSESDISFVMYYAPWDAESQSTRTQFKIVAQYFYKQIYFAAINCWQPHSECKQQFNKVQQFPVLIVYTQHNKGIQYKGIREATHMIRFLQFFLRPLEQIRTHDDLINLMTTHDAVVVGFFNFLGNVGGAGYYTFYSAALKFLERDPYREIGFAVVTDVGTAEKLMVDEIPSVRLYMWNETLLYSRDDEYTPDSLVKWISGNAHQVSVWVSPPGVKSLTLAPYVEDGSVLIMFTPRNPLDEHFYNYKLLREIGLEYYNCDENPWVMTLASRLAAERVSAATRQQEMEAECLVWKEHHQEVPHVQVVGRHWTNDSCRSMCEGKCRWTEGDLNFGPLHRHHYTCCKHTTHASYETSMLSGMGDERSSSALQEAFTLEKCRRLRRARTIYRPIFPHPAYHRKSPRRFTGLACRTNRTISLIAMDSLQFHQFAEGLGIDILKRTDKTAVVIFNVIQESSYILEGDVSKGAILEFITNYTDGTLNRSLRSSGGKLQNTLNQYPIQSEESCHSENVVCVRELNSNNFHSVVMTPNVAVVVLYHSPYCTFCHGISHIYLTVARYFHAVHNLTFVRIDGENNDLPWELTMHHYPTILFFPAIKKSESRVFPRHHPITIPNLVNFVLANLDPGEGSLRGMIGLCAGWERQHDDTMARDCIVRLRRDCLTAINATLKQYRVMNTRWHVYHKQLKHSLLRLQYLKEIHLMLGAVNRLSPSCSEYATILEAIERYHSNVKDFVPTVTNFTSNDRFIRDEL
ncbi:hypothetical protein L9F63_002849 [Diploptera punctata]|uniref:Thioredoxin domain-containing protein n=1 Tax=Diploptera punctata TaxID=6984 RepID=A0AAD7ZRP5_DIPPU|nr:hypothetical protein L9F63_002849 [Diploptera punctata]